MEKPTSAYDIDKVIYSKDEIDARIKEIGKQITHDYFDKQDQGIVVLCILKGAAVFMSDLIRNIDLRLQIDYLSVSSYGMTMKSSGEITLRLDTSLDLSNKHVIIAEDIIDSGLTLEKVCKHIKSKGAASVTVCALLDKNISTCDLDVKYKCFDCPDEFIVGYGIDYAENYRNLPFVSSVVSEQKE